MLVAGVLGGCRPEYVRDMRQLEGRWEIAKAEVLTINQDGSTSVLEYENVGYIEITQDPFDSDGSGGLKQAIMEYDDGVVRTSFNGYLHNDEDNKRLWMSYYFCNNIFNCDLSWDIERDGGRTQVWASYFNDLTGRNQYSPGTALQHIKWTWTLKKQGL